jgi:hypothetical protein
MPEWLSTRYEDLRAQVLGRGDGHDAAGFFVVMRQGMAAWIEASRARRRLPVSPDLAPPRIPEPSAEAELVSLLASMVQHWFQEKRA